MLPFELTKDTPYLALSGKLWSVFYEYFNRNWSCYKGFPLYLKSLLMDDKDQHSLYHACSPFHWHGLTLIPAWINNQMLSKVWGAITDPFLNFNGCTVEV